MDWFLYDRDLCHESVKGLKDIYFNETAALITISKSKKILLGIVFSLSFACQIENSPRFSRRNLFTRIVMKFKKKKNGFQIYLVVSKEMTERKYRFEVFIIKYH